MLSHHLHLPWSANCRFMIRVYCTPIFLTVLLLGGQHPNWCQESIVDSVFQLEVVEIVGRPFMSTDLTDKVIRLTDAEVAAFHMESLSGTLQSLAGVAVRQYGPAGIGTASFRGGSAAQTSVVWNGFPIQNPMLAQADLSLIATGQFDEIGLHYGSGSSLWGNGAVGGTITLRDMLTSMSGSRLALRSGMGSFGFQQHGLNWEIGGRNLSSQIKLLRRSARNDFQYVDLFGEEQRLDHAQTIQNSIQFNPSFRWRNQKVSFYSWWQNASRNIPPTKVQPRSVAHQEDEQLRMALAYALEKDDWSFHARAARLEDRVSYQDSLLDLFTNNRAFQWWGEIAAKKNWTGGHQLELLSQYNHQIGRSDSYVAGPNVRSNTSGTLRYTFQKGTKWMISGRLRQEWSDGQRLPVMPYIGFYSAVLPYMQIKGSVSRSYRLPGLNDMFWNPGGNPSLRPETGWAQELAVQVQPLPVVSYQITGFHRNVMDWIQWVPGASFWAPENIQTVTSKGLEQELTMKHHSANASKHLRVSYNWVRSTDKGDDPAITGRQIIYIPEHQLGLQAQWNWTELMVRLGYQWNSRRFTTRDHSSELAGFHLGQLAFGWHKSW